MENFTPGTMDALGLGYEHSERPQPAPHLRRHLRLRPDRPRPQPPGARHHRAGHGRRHEHHRRAGWPARAPRRLAGRHHRRPLHRDRHPRRAARARDAAARARWSTSACSTARSPSSRTPSSATSRPASPRSRSARATRSPRRSRPSRRATAGSSIALSWGVENQWELFCATIGRADLIDDKRFDTPGLRTRNHADLEPLLNDALRRTHHRRMAARVRRHRPALRPAQRHPGAAEQPQVKAREMLVDVSHPSGFSAEDRRIRR